MLNNKWYPVQLPLSFRAYCGGALLQAGVGETVEISSRGIRALLAEDLAPSCTVVELSIAWPASLPRDASIRLVMAGAPVSRSQRTIEIGAGEHEFRTGRQATAAG